MKNAVLILSLVLVPLAFAQTPNRDDFLSYSKSGTEFVRICDAGDTPKMVVALCATYADGMAAGIGAATSEAQFFFCAPPEVTAGQEMLVLIQYIKTHPEKAHLPPAILFKDALRTAFPCGGKPSQNQ